VRKRRELWVSSYVSNSAAALPLQVILPAAVLAYQSRINEEPVFVSSYFPERTFPTKHEPARHGPVHLVEGGAGHTAAATCDAASSASIGPCVLERNPVRFERNRSFRRSWRIGLA
jgi:hypothetical protein